MYIYIYIPGTPKTIKKQRFSPPKTWFLGTKNRVFDGFRCPRYFVDVPKAGCVHLKHSFVTHTTLFESALQRASPSECSSSQTVLGPCSSDRLMLNCLVFTFCSQKSNYTRAFQLPVLEALKYLKTTSESTGSWKVLVD